MENSKQISLDLELRAWREMANTLEYPVFIINSRRKIVNYNNKADALLESSQHKSTLCHKMIYDRNQICEHCTVFSKNQDFESLYNAGFNTSKTLLNDKTVVANKYRPYSRHIIKSQTNDFYLIEGIKQDENRAEIQERLITMGAISLTLAHEISNPITGLNLSVQSLHNLLARESGDTRDKVLQIAKLIEQDIQRASGIIVDIQNYSKPFSYSAKLTNVYQTLKIALEASLRIKPMLIPEIVWKWQVPEAVCVIGNRRKLEQAFINLFNNCLEAFILIQKEAPEAPKLEIHAEKIAEGADKGHIQIHILDNAGGINNDNLNKIFSPYYSTKTDHTGMGLFIVQKIMNEHGGKVQHTSHGQSTVVEIILPEA
ncbi:MAG: HAMP domain-containing sensor histidine kinase [Leptospirales bacterium]